MQTQKNNKKTKFGINCEICDKGVTIVDKKNKLWICRDCDAKYPTWQ